MRYRRGCWPGSSSDKFVRKLNTLGTTLVQVGVQENNLNDRLAGLELLRCLMRFDDKNATTRRLDCLSLLHTVLENKRDGTIH